MKKPVFLFSDSQLLFWKNDDSYWLESITKCLDGEDFSAAYIGAANNNEPVFYELFQAAMQNIGIQNTRMIILPLTEDDEQFLKETDILLLAGGDIQVGWQKLINIEDLITRRYEEGLLLMGVSAGATHLGRFGWTTAKSSGNLEFFETLGIVPHIIDSHEETSNWRTLYEALNKLDYSGLNGIGIPTGTGVIFTPDGDLLAIKNPVVSLSWNAEKARNG